MSLVLEALTATICVIGLAGFVWWLVGRILRPMPRNAVRVLLAGRGDGEELEQTLREFMWLRSLGMLHCPIIIADVDLTPEGYELAQSLAKKWPGVSVRAVRDSGGYLF